MYSISDGERIVKAARAAVELHLTSRIFNSKMIERYISDLYEKTALFVTLEHYPTNTSRGSGGSTKATQPLHLAVVNAAVAATEDKRFVPVSHLEFEHLLVEVSILSGLERITVKSENAIMKKIALGKHGLYIEYGYHSAVLLPEVPVKNAWGRGEALNNLCKNAGLGEHVWKTGTAKLYLFTTQRFREMTPRGAIDEILTE